MHIGLIGGIGPAATEFYYRGLTDRHAKSGTRLELTIANAEVRDLSQNLANKNARKQAEIFAALISRLKAAGAQIAAVTSMGGHFCIGELLPISPLPILNGIPEVDTAVGRGKFKTIGIIGTRMVMETTGRALHEIAKGHLQGMEQGWAGSFDKLRRLLEK